MKTQRLMFLATVFAALSTPVLAQVHDGSVHASPGQRMGPATMGDMRGMMQTLMNDPVISKRMNELMSSNPAFKAHFDRMQATMNSAGMMTNGTGGMMTNGTGGMMTNGTGGMRTNGTGAMHGSMMNGGPSPKP